MQLTWPLLIHTQAVPHTGQLRWCGWQVLRGDRIENSLYKLFMNVEESCKILCRQEYTEDQMKEFAEKVVVPTEPHVSFTVQLNHYVHTCAVSPIGSHGCLHAAQPSLFYIHSSPHEHGAWTDHHSGQVHDEYRVHWLVDNLPAATRVVRDVSDSNALTYSYERGYPLGFVGGTEIMRNKFVEVGVDYVHNHVRLIVKYHKSKDAPASGGATRVVGFEVEPFSVKHKYDDWPTLKSCSPLQAVRSDMEPQRVDQAGEIVWTYDVRWDYSDVKWASRWDMYVLTTDDQVLTTPLHRNMLCSCA